MSSPTVSLVVLNWNGREHLDDCLSSLAALDYPEADLELILCDNGSSDGSVEHVRVHHPRFRIVELDHNHGFAEGNNLAAAAARGAWVGFLNNDMKVPPDWLRKMLEPLEDQPALACIASSIRSWDGSLIDFIGGGTDFLGHGLQRDHGAVSSEHDVARRVLFACGGAMLIRRELFTEVGGFDPRYFAYFEDVDLGWRLNLIGHDVWYTPEARVLHRHHGTSTRLAEKQLRTLTERNALYTIYKNYDDANLNLVLPVALGLLVEKALVIADIDVSAFRPASQAPRFEAPPRAPALPPRRSPASRLMAAIRERGMGTAARLAWRETRFALARGIVGRPDFRAVVPPPPPGSQAFPDAAVSQIVAISEMAHSLDGLKGARAWVQSRRRRTDDEVLALGRVGLEDPTSDSSVYVGFQHWISVVAGIDDRFRELEL